MDCNLNCFNLLCLKSFDKKKTGRFLPIDKQIGPLASECLLFGEWQKAKVTMFYDFRALKERKLTEIRRQNRW